MGLFKKKADPIKERERALKAELAALESQIKKLDNQIESGVVVEPRKRETPPAHASAPAAAKMDAPVFEKIDSRRLNPSTETVSTPQHFNELGVRKYDLIALIERIKKRFQGPPLSNPKLINYLAAGSVHGLRPLRYEKRVARNRFILVVIVSALVLLGLFAAFFGNR